MSDPMRTSYGQFCPVAKASEIVATRWTPLILRELMTGAKRFSEIQQGIPLISRAMLVSRLGELEAQGIVHRDARNGGHGHEYVLTDAGEDLRDVLSALGRWGERHSYDAITDDDLDPGVLLWGLRRQIDRSVLPNRRVVLLFDFLNLPSARLRFQRMWLTLMPLAVDVCVKDPGYPVDFTLRGDIRDFIALYLDRVSWRESLRGPLRIEGSTAGIASIPTWLALEPRSRRPQLARLDEHLPTRSVEPAPALTHQG
jgi:DNA-binding HxlR family transcriptional regulator